MKIRRRAAIAAAQVAVVALGISGAATAAAFIGEAAHAEVAPPDFTVRADPATLVDYHAGTWYLTDHMTGNTIATFSGCVAEDDCVAEYRDHAWTITHIDH